MKAFLRRIVCAATVLALLSLPAFAQTKANPAKGGGFHVPVEYYKLPNGLKVVLSQDHTAPTVAVAVYYNIGFRIEPKDRTGFAHLFEHMMFQGSRNLGKMEFVRLIQANGGVFNGSTRFDYTNYFEVMPSHKLETALWAEADRMKGLAITQDNLTNQQGVVSNESAVRRLPVAGHAAVRQHQLVQRPQLLRRPEGSRSRHPRGREKVLRSLLHAQQRGPRRGRRL
jgi:predicted Zn-dependent peptidase